LLNIIAFLLKLERDRNRHHSYLSRNTIKTKESEIE